MLSFLFPWEALPRRFSHISSPDRRRYFGPPWTLLKHLFSRQANAPPTLPGRFFHGDAGNTSWTILRIFMDSELSASQRWHICRRINCETFQGRCPGRPEAERQNASGFPSSDNFPSPFLRHNRDKRTNAQEEKQ